MRGEILIHVVALLTASFSALGLYLTYTDMILLYDDVLTYVFLEGFFITIAFCMVFLKIDDDYFEKDSFWVLLERILIVIAFMVLAGIVWNIGMYVDSIFIYVLIVWGYVISVIALTIAEVVFKFKKAQIVIEKG